MTAREFFDELTAQFSMLNGKTISTFTALKNAVTEVEKAASNLLKVESDISLTASGVFYEHDGDSILIGALYPKYERDERTSSGLGDKLKEVEIVPTLEAYLDKDLKTYLKHAAFERTRQTFSETYEAMLECKHQYIKTLSELSFAASELYELNSNGTELEIALRARMTLNEFPRIDDGDERERERIRLPEEEMVL